MRNTWVICLRVQDNSLKGGVILDVDIDWEQLISKAGDRKAWCSWVSPRPIS